VSASVTLNFNKWIGVEGELGGGVGMRQDLTFNAATLPNPNPDVREFIHPKALAIGEMLPTSSTDATPSPAIALAGAEA
jgi:hypothetical protein